MEAAIRLRLANDLRGPARDAENDLDRSREATRTLDGAIGGDKLAADLAKIERQVGEAKAELDPMDRTASQFGTGTGRELLHDLGRCGQGRPDRSIGQSATLIVSMGNRGATLGGVISLDGGELVDRSGEAGERDRN